ncbi:MAG: DUF6788 family protein [Acidimicrobiales bacterium]
MNGAEIDEFAPKVGVKMPLETRDDAKALRAYREAFVDATKPRQRDTQQHDRTVAALGQSGPALPGNLVTRSLRCGKAGCRCKADPPQLHGPYHQWTRKVDGKTVTRWLSVEQVARYRPWFDNARRLRALITQLEALSLAVAETNEGWEPQPAPTGHRPRNATTSTTKPQPRSTS